MKAKFIGQDGSLGFRTGVIYDVEIEPRLVYARGSNSSPPPANNLLCVYTLTEPKRWCPYSNFECILDNWEFIKKKRGIK